MLNRAIRTYAGGRIGFVSIFHLPALSIKYTWLNNIHTAFAFLKTTWGDTLGIGSALDKD
jgi:hypothetical protein